MAAVEITIRATKHKFRREMTSTVRRNQEADADEEYTNHAVANKIYQHYDLRPSDINALDFRVSLI